jgi:hypothetical protein
MFGAVKTAQLGRAWANISPTYVLPGDFGDDANTRLLMKFEDNYSDTNTTGRTAKSFSTSGTPDTSSTYKKFGTESFYSAPSTFLTNLIQTTTDFDDFKWYERDFTCETWAYIPSFTDHTFSSGSFSIPKLMGGTASNDYGWAFGFRSDAKLSFWYWNGSVGMNIVSTETFATNTWHHIVMDHRLGDKRIRIGANGVFLNSAGRTGSPAAGNTFSIGTVRLNSPEFYLDNLRISHMLRY